MSFINIQSEIEVIEKYSKMNELYLNDVTQEGYLGVSLLHFIYPLWSKEDEKIQRSIQFLKRVQKKMFDSWGYDIPKLALIKWINLSLLLQVKEGNQKENIDFYNKLNPKTSEDKLIQKILASKDFILKNDLGSVTSKKKIEKLITEGNLLTLLSKLTNLETSHPNYFYIIPLAYKIVELKFGEVTWDNFLEVISFSNRLDKDTIIVHRRDNEDLEPWAKYNLVTLTNSCIKVYNWVSFKYQSVFFYAEDFYDDDVNEIKNLDNLLGSISELVDKKHIDTYLKHLKNKNYEYIYVYDKSVARFNNEMLKKASLSLGFNVRAIDYTLL